MRPIKFKTAASILCLTLLLLTTSCSYSHSSMATLWTDDCGKSWRKIPVGEAIPGWKGICGYTVSLPDSPLSGDTDFKVNFKGKVTADLKTSYVYTIHDPIAYIQNAKFLGKPNANQEDSDDTNARVQALELAESTIIDKVVKEEAANTLIQEDIATYNPQDIEVKLLKDINKVLSVKGIELGFIQTTVIADPLTRAALDAISAKRIYDANGMGAEGNRLMEARAGAGTINIGSELLRPSASPQPSKASN